jgi:hypothetical protein
MALEGALVSHQSIRLAQDGGFQSARRFSAAPRCARLKPAVQSGFPIRHDEPKVIPLRALVFFLHEGRDQREWLNVLVLILAIALVVGLAWRGNVKP